MVYDSLVLHSCLNKLKPELIGSKVNKIHQPDEYTIIIRYRGREIGGRLLICVHPNKGRIHKTTAAKENPAKAPLFVMVLRKWLEGARITDVQATPGERVAAFIFESRNELGDPITLSLIAEIMGKHSNIILIDNNGNILDGIRRYGSHLSRYREVLPGKKYIPPPPLDKLPFLPKNQNQLAEALYQESDLILSKAMIRQIKGVSPVLSRAIPMLAGLDPQQPADSIGEYEINKIYRQLETIQQTENEGGAPIVLYKGHAPIDYYVFPLPEWEGKKTAPFDDINQAIDTCFIYQDQLQEMNKARHLLAKSLKQRQQRLEKKIALEEADLADCQAAESFKEKADLLAGNMFYIKKGIEEIDLPSYSDPQKIINIKLDPAKTPQENIQQYYKKYSKAKKAYTLIEDQLIANRNELDYLQSIQQAAEDCEEIFELELIEKEAIAAGFIKSRFPEKKDKNTKPAALQPRQFISSDGFVILIGRNNRQNDKLSLKMAKPEDIWLHAQKIPGSHTIIVSDGRQVPQSTIIEAASYAAWFSKAKESGKTPVDYTFAENLKKPNGAVPGFVTYTGQNTVYVEPCPPPDTD